MLHESRDSKKILSSKDSHVLGNASNKELATLPAQPVNFSEYDNSIHQPIVSFPTHARGVQDLYYGSKRAVLQARGRAVTNPTTISSTEYQHYIHEVYTHANQTKEQADRIVFSSDKKRPTSPSIYTPLSFNFPAGYVRQTSPISLNRSSPNILYHSRIYNGTSSNSYSPTHRKKIVQSSTNLPSHKTSFFTTSCNSEFKPSVHYTNIRNNFAPNNSLERASGVIFSKHGSLNSQVAEVGTIDDSSSCIILDSNDDVRVDDEQIPSSDISSQVMSNYDNSQMQQSDDSDEVICISDSGEDHNEIIHKESIDETVHGEPINSEGIDNESFDDKTIHSETTDNESVDESNHSETFNGEITDSESVNDEKIHGEPIGTEVIDNETVDDKTIHSEITDNESGEESNYSEMFNVEITDKESVDGEKIHGKPIDTEVIDSGPVDGETMYIKLIDSELNHGESAKAEPIHNELICNDTIHEGLINNETINNESNHIETVYSETIHIELVDNKSASSESIHSESTRSEDTHSPSCISNQIPFKLSPASSKKDIYTSDDLSAEDNIVPDLLPIEEALGQCISVGEISGSSINLDDEDDHSEPTSSNNDPWVGIYGAKHYSHSNQCPHHECTSDCHEEEKSDSSIHPVIDENNIITPILSRAAGDVYPIYTDSRISPEATHPFWRFDSTVSNEILDTQENYHTFTELELNGDIHKNSRQLPEIPCQDHEKTPDRHSPDFEIANCDNENSSHDIASRDSPRLSDASKKLSISLSLDDNGRCKDFLEHIDSQSIGKISPLANTTEDKISLSAEDANLNRGQYIVSWLNEQNPQHYDIVASSSTLPLVCDISANMTKSSLSSVDHYSADENINCEQTTNHVYENKDTKDKVLESDGELSLSKVSLQDPNDDSSEIGSVHSAVEDIQNDSIGSKINIKRLPSISGSDNEDSGSENSWYSDSDEYYDCATELDDEGNEIVRSVRAGKKRRRRPSNYRDILNQSRELTELGPLPREVSTPYSLRRILPEPSLERNANRRLSTGPTHTTSLTRANATPYMLREPHEIRHTDSQLQEAQEVNVETSPKPRRSSRVKRARFQ